MGWRQTEIAAVAGVSTGAVSTAKEPGVVINVSTAQKILAVNPTSARWNPGGYSLAAVTGAGQLTPVPPRPQ